MEADWRKLKPSMCQTMSHILETGLYTDMTFRVGPTRFQVDAHKVIVMARSEVFATKCKDYWDENMADSIRSTISIPDSWPSSFNIFLKYLYTDEFATDVLVEDAIEVLRLAHMYQVHGLISKCSAFLESSISVENCVQIYQGTRLYVQEEGGLSSFAYEFITKNIKNVLNTEEFLGMDEQGLTALLQNDSLEVDEIELFKAILRWGNEEVHDSDIEALNYKPRKATLTSLIPLIRFPLMGPQVFATEVVPTKVLSNEEALELFLYFNGVMTATVTFLAKPRGPLPLTFKNLKCYDKDTVYSLGEVECFYTNGPGMPTILQFRLRCDQAITIHGIIYPGPIKQTIFDTSPINLLYEIKLKVSDAMRILYEKHSTIQITEFNNFKLLLDQPLRLKANQPYWIYLSVKVTDEREAHIRNGSSCPQINVFHTIFVRGKEVELNDDATIFKILFCPWSFQNRNHTDAHIRLHMQNPSSTSETSYGMINSIIYTL